MAQVKFTNNGKTTLNGAIEPSVTSIVVTDGSVLPSLSGGDWFYLTIEDNSLNREIVKVTARTINTLTVVRGSDGTTAAAWATGVKAENRLTLAALNEMAAAIAGITPGTAFLTLVDDATVGDLRTSLGFSTLTDYVTLIDTQTLTNKTLSSPTLSGTVAGSPTASGNWTFSQAGDVIALTNTSKSLKLYHDGGTMGIYTSASQPLYLGSNGNVLSGIVITAGVVAAASGYTGQSGAAVPTISSTDTLTNKTLTSPTLSGTVAGNVTFSGNLTFTGATSISINTTEPRLDFYETNAGSDAKRWSIINDAGSFGLQTRTDADVFGQTAIFISRSGTTVGTIALSGTALTFGGVAIPTISSTDTLSNKTLTSPTLSGTVAGSVTFSGNITLSGVTSIASSSRLDGAAGTQRLFYYTSSGAARWSIGLDSTAESGSNAGSPLSIFAFTDAQAYNGTALSINRSTLAATFGGSIDVAGVAIPTISSTDTLSNKTLSSPTLSGTVAGSPTFNGNNTFSSTAIFGTVADEAIRIQNDGGYLSFYNDAGSTRRGYIYNGATYLGLVNEITNGDWAFTTNGTGVLRHGGVEIPTLSSTGTLTNKTLPSPTLSGTVAGSPTASGVWTFGNSPQILNASQSAIRLHRADGTLGYTLGRSIGTDDAHNFFLYDNIGFGSVFSVNSSRVMDFSVAPTSGGVAIPTISSTDTLTNKTLTSPTINGGSSSSALQTSSETIGALTSASANKKVACSGGVTLPASGMTDGDMVFIDPRGTARTITRPGAHTMYVNDTDSATATTKAHNVAMAVYHGSSKWTLHGVA